MDSRHEQLVVDSSLVSQCAAGAGGDSEPKSDDHQWLIVSKRDSKSRLLPPRMVFVGRQDCDICVPSTTVDTRHAVLFFNDHCFHVKDLNSAYGTYVNDKRISGQCYIRLEHLDRLRFGFGPDLFIIEKISSMPEKSSADPKLFADETESFRNSDSLLSQEIEEKPTKEIEIIKDPVHKLIFENCGSNSSLSNSVDSLEDIKSAKVVMSVKVSDKRMLPEMNQEVNESATTTAPDTCASPSAAPDSLESTISATAFTISFDDDDKKKLKIKDSLRRFAPPKPDSIEKPRPKSAKSESKSHENSFASRKSPTTPQRTKRQNNASADKSFNPNKYRDNKSKPAAILSADTSGNLSDSAAYLIERMLSNRKLNTTPSHSRPGSSEDHRVEKTDSGVSDDIKSDSGNTYTVDDNNDELVDARRRIDEVFGVNDNDSATISLNSSPDSSLTLNSPTLIRNIEHSNQLSKTRNLLSSPKFDRKSIASDSDQKLGTNNSTFTRTKRRVPTAEEMLHLVRPIRDEKQKMNTSYVGSNDLNKNNHRSTSSETQSKAGGTQSAPSTPRSPLMSRRLMELRVNTKQNSKPINNTNSRRKNSWNSDMDYYELYNSDDSTDQSHRSSNSALSRDNGHTSVASVPSKINLNRTFALRRARLGIETPGIDLSSKKVNPNLNRNDGGRFSLRVGKKETQSDTNSDKRPVNRISSKESAIKSNLTRKGSDPFTSSKQVVNKMRPFSDTERRNSLNNNRFNSNQSPISSSYRQNLSQNSKNTFTRVTTPQRFLNKTQTTQHSNHSNSNSLRNYNIANYESERNTSPSGTEPAHKPPINSYSYKSPSKTGLELTALDGLVISAISQLSNKMRNNMIDVMESQRLSNPCGSPQRSLIEEVLPQLTNTDRRINDNNVSVSRDLSAILKNLKKVEQSLEVITALIEPNSSNTSKSYRKQKNNVFVVDV